MSNNEAEREKWEANIRQHYSIDKLKERNDAHLRHLDMPSEYQIEAAINETNYKYFGDYEMSEGQRIAVEVLIEAALAGQVAQQPQPTTVSQEVAQGKLSISELRNAVNHPDKDNPGKRIIGWRVDAETAGLSDALFFLEKLKVASLQNTPPLAGVQGDVELVCEARDLIIVANRAASKLKTAYLRYEIEPRYEYDQFIEQREAMRKFMEKARNLLSTTTVTGQQAGEEV